MLKKTAFLFTFLIFCAGFWYAFKGNQQTKIEEVAAKGWDKFEKKDKKTSFSHAKTIDLKAHQVPKALLNNRKPASEQKKYAMREGRYLEGQDFKKYSNPTEKLTFKNRVNPDWKKNLGHQLTRFQEEGTEVLIKREKGIIFVTKGTGEYREKVLISYKMPDGRRSSYRAMIDSSNGKILYTFNRQINEDFRRRPAGLTHPLAQ